MSEAVEPQVIGANEEPIRPNSLGGTVVSWDGDFDAGVGEVVRVINEPTYLVRTELGREVFVRASTAQPVSQEERLLYWRKRASYAEGRLRR